MSQASMGDAWVRRNSVQLGPALIGEGSMPSRRRKAQALEGASTTPDLDDSPRIRPSPQAGFSRAKRRMIATVPAGMVRRRWSEPHRPGRRPIPAGTVAIILRFARENPAWGDGRILGESSRSGVVLAPSSAWAFLRRDGIDPSPMRAGPSWTEFLRTQASPMLACDIFTVDAVLLKRLYVLFFIELDPRRAYVTGVTANPIRAWVVQQARNLSMVLATRTHPVRFLIRDRDTEFTSGLDDIFRSEGIWIIRTPVRAPRANALAERFVGTVRREGLDRMLIFGRLLERVLADHVAHDDEHRPHRALDQQPPLGVDEPLLIGDPEPSQFRRRDTVFGLMHEYQLVA